MTPDEIALRDYELKLDYLNRQYERLWNRFSYFLTVELALFGASGYLIFDKCMLSACIFPIAGGIAVSILWWIVGAQDRYLVVSYRSRVDLAANAVSPNATSGGFAPGNHAGASVSDHFTKIRQWYWSDLSITQLPATIAIAMVAIWIAFLGVWLGWLLMGR